MFALIPLFAVAVTVSGTSDCPLPQTVQAAIEGMSQANARASQTIFIQVDGARMTVTLRGEGDVVLSSKSFPQAYSCAERAQIAAVFASTWDLANTLDSPMADVVAPVANSSAVPPSSPTSPSSQNSAASISSQVPVRASVVSATAPTTPRVFRLGLGVGGLSGAAFQEQSAGLGVSAEGVFRPKPTWGIKAELIAMPERIFTVGPGSASLERWGAGVGYLRRMPFAWGSAFADISALVAYSVATGQDVEAAKQQTAWVPAARLGAGFDLVATAHLRLGLDLSVFAWARSETLAVQSPTAATLALPQADFLLRLSAAWESQK